MWQGVVATLLIVDLLFGLVYYVNFWVKLFGVVVFTWLLWMGGFWG